MTIRTRGFVWFLGSVVVGLALYWFLFHFVVTGTGGVHLPAYPLALPIVGAVKGLLEWITGVPMERLDQGWQKLPAYARIPMALAGSALLLWGFLWVVGKSLGA